MNPRASTACTHHSAKCHVAALGASTPAAANSRGGEVADRRQARQRRVGEDDSQAFDDVAGDADRDEQHEDADVGRAAGEAAAAAQPPHEEHHAAGEKRDAEGVHHEFVDAEVDALVKHGVARLAAQQVGEHVLDGDQRRADEQHDEAAEQQHVGQAGRTAAAAEAALQQHVAQQPPAGERRR